LLKILSGGDDTGNEAMELKKHTDWILSVSYSNDGLLVASGDRFGGIQVWNAKTGEVFASLRGHTAAVSSLGWFSDGETLVSGSLDGTIRWWSMNSLEQTASWDAHKGGVTAIAMAPDDSLWSTGNDQRVCGWTFADGDRILRSSDLPGKGVALSLGNQARSLAVSDSEGHVYVASLEDVFSGSFSEESKEAGWIQVELPVQPSPRTYAIYSPSPPNRSPLEINPPKISAPSAIESKPVMGMDSIRKSLEEVEAALEKARETTTQLERAAEQLRALLQEQESSK
jgi:WD40 repeat protein